MTTDKLSTFAPCDDRDECVHTNCVYSSVGGTEYLPCRNKQSFCPDCGGELTQGTVRAPYCADCRKFVFSSNMKQYKPRTATEAFTAHLAGIKAQLETLKRAAENSLGYDLDRINWGHVGTASHIKDQLKEITRSF